jgi:CheY-like chemotaxis protein
VLVAEDNFMNQPVINAMLRKLGLEPKVVADGKAAVEAMQTGQYELVFMDCQMRVMDGLEATRQIRGLPVRSGRPWIVAVSANAMAGDPTPWPVT